MENVYLAYETAWWYWQNAKQGATTLGVAPRTSTLQAEASGERVVRSIVAGTLLEGRRLSVATTWRGAKDSKMTRFRYSPKRLLPEGSYVRIGRNIYVASPELSFVQAAHTLSLAKTILYGYALCGTFVLDPTAKSGTAQRPALTTVENLQAFLKSCTGMRGARKALQALHYILEGSASPAESKTAILLSLPLRHGGYGIISPQLNVEIILPPHLQKLTGRRKVRADFLWESQRVAAEYDSEAEHQHALSQCNDSTKRIALQELGYATFAFTSPQLHNPALMDATAAALRSALGERKPQSLPQDYLGKKRLLRQELGLPC